MKIYKPKKSVMGGGLIMLAIVFFGLTLPLLIEGAPVEMRKLLGLGSFWLMGIILTLVPLGFKLEIDEDYVSTYFFGFRTRNLYAPNVKVLEYGNLFRGGLGFGKGLKGWERIDGRVKFFGFGRIKYFSIGEAIYGKEAIVHAKRVLERKS